MNRKTLYIILVLIALSALFISFMIFPFYKPLSLMYYYNQEYEKSFRRYHELYEQNDRSISTVGPLILLNLQYANVTEALRLMREYTEKNPDDPENWKYLGNLYLGSARPHSYLWTAEELFKLKPSLISLRDLIGYYTYYGYNEKLFESYKILIKDYKADTWEHVILAELYASKSLYNDALATLKQGLEIKTSKSAAGYAAEVYISLLLNLNRIEEARSFAINFINKNPNPLIAQSILTFFRDHNQPKEVLAIIDTLPPKLQYDSEIIGFKVTSYYMLGEDSTLYGYLKELYYKDKLPNDQVSGFISLGLNEEPNPIFFEQLIKDQNFKKLNEFDLIILLQKAHHDNLPMLKDKLRLETAVDLYASSPLLRYVYNLILNPAINLDNLSFYLSPDVEKLSVDEQVQLAATYDELNLKSLAKKILQSIKNYDRISVSFIVQFATLLESYGLEKMGFERMNQVVKNMKHPPKEFKLALLVLGIASDNFQEIAPELAELFKEPNQDELEILFSVAYQHKFGELSEKIARTLDEINPSAEHERLLAEALILNGKKEEGFAILEELVKDHPDDFKIKNSYLLALIEIAPSSPEHLQLVREELAKVLHDEHFPDSNLRDLGYKLVDLKLEKEATPIFYRLGHDKPFSNEDSEMLRFVLGEKIPEEYLGWAKERTLKAKGNEKAKWLRYLIDTKNEKLAYQLIFDHDLKNEKILDIAFEVLILLKYERELECFLTDFLPYVKNLEKLKKLGKRIFEESMRSAAEQVFLRVLELNTNDREALRNLAEIYFATGEFSHARYFLGLFLCLYQGDYRTYYLMGELYFRDKAYIDAEAFFHGALNDINDRALYTKEARMISAQIYIRLNLPRTGFRIYENLLDDYPTDLSLRAEFGSALIEWGVLNWAMCVLFDVPIGKSEPEEQLQLARTQALWFLRANEMEEAYTYADSLIQQDPQDASRYALLALIDENAGYWIQSLAEWQIAKNLNPRNEDYQREYRLLYNLHLPFVFGDWEYRKTGDTQREHYLRFGGDWRYENDLNNRFSYLIEQDRINVNNFTEVNGETVPLKKALRRRGELRWFHENDYGLGFSSELYFAKHIFGVGGEWRRLDNYGFTRARIEYRKPNWDYVETIIEFGSRDRIFLERAHRLYPRFNAIINTAFNRYYLSPLSGRAADSFSWQGFFTYEVFPLNSIRQTLNRDQNIYLEYSIDAEYPTWLARRIDSSGQSFNPLPIVNREIHTLQFIVTKTLCKNFEMAGNFGYAYDRFGINILDEVYGAWMSWNRRPGLTFKVLYDHSPSTSSPGQNEDRLLFNLTYYY